MKKMEDEREDKTLLDTSRKQSWDKTKLYKQMLFKEIPGMSATNAPMHAVIEDELGEIDEEKEGCSTIRNHALIHYIATLSNSNKIDDIFDTNFVESLVKNGAEINSPDKTGQTIFHEVAKSWNIDVAKFLIKIGANANKQDQFGRSPLHVAAAVDYAEMVEFLLENGATIAITTYGEEQSPLHYAAKNDAVNSLQTLLGYGADIDARDSKNRTALQVSAEMNRSKAAKLLVSEGAPAGVYDNAGNSALSLLIEKIPEVALEALDQFHSTDTINRKELYFLNYLEGKKLNDHKASARSPLEIAVQNERFDIILHPIMQRLITVKWQMYAKRSAVWDLVLNLLYTVIWTVIGVTIPRHGHELYFPLKDHIWRLVFAALVVLFTLQEIKTQIQNTIKTGRELEKWREWRATELEDDIQYCHPRWPQETKFLQSEIDAVRNLSLISSTDWWMYFDWTTLLFVLASIGTHVAFFYYSTDLFKEIHHHIMIPLLMILWFRLFKYARPFEGAGPLVVIFGSVFNDIAKWGFLNSIIIIPFTCAFWITFGAISLHPVDGYDTVGPLLYNMFSMMVVGEHQFAELVKANPILSRLLCMGFIGIVAIVTLNLLIALLSNTFERLYENAVANAIMQRGRTILMLEKWMTKKQLNRYYDFIRENGSPETAQTNVGGTELAKTEDRVNMERVSDDIKTVKGILVDRFGKRYGKYKSPLDVVKDDLTTVKTLQQELAHDIKYTKIMLQGMANQAGLFINVDTYTRSNNNNNDDDDNNNNNTNTNNSNPNTYPNPNNNSNNNNNNNNNNRNNNNNNNNNSSNNNNNNNNSNSNNNNSSGNSEVTTTNITSNTIAASTGHLHHQTTSPLHKPHERSEESSVEEASGHDSSLLMPPKKKNVKSSAAYERKEDSRKLKKKRKTFPPSGSAELPQGKRDDPVHNLPHHEHLMTTMIKEQPHFAQPQSPDSALELPRASREFIPKPMQPSPYYHVNPLVHQPWDRKGSPGYLVRESPQPRPYFRESNNGFTPPQHYFSESKQQPQYYHSGRRTSALQSENLAHHHHHQASNDDQRDREEYYRQARGGLEIERFLQPAMLPSGNIMAYDDMLSNRQRPTTTQDFLRFQEFHQEGFPPDRRNGVERSRNFPPQQYLAGYVLPVVPQERRVSLPVFRQQQQQPLLGCVTSPDPSYERRETRADNKMAYGEEMPDLKTAGNDDGSRRASQDARGALRNEDGQALGTSSDSEELENRSFLAGNIEKKVARNLTKATTAVASKIKEKVIYFEEKTGTENKERKDEGREENEKKKEDDRESKL